MSARRPACVRDAIRPVEHEAAGAFEERAARLELAEIHDARNPVAMLGAERAEHVGAPLEAAARRLHRIQHGRAVRVQAEPVVGEHLVGRRGTALARERVHAHARGGECDREPVELTCGARRNVRVAAGGALEVVRLRRLGVCGEADRPDHQHGRRGLWLGGRGGGRHRAQHIARRGWGEAHRVQAGGEACTRIARAGGAGGASARTPGSLRTRCEAGRNSAAAVARRLWLAVGSRGSLCRSVVRRAPPAFGRFA